MTGLDHGFFQVTTQNFAAFAPIHPAAAATKQTSSSVPQQTLYLQEAGTTNAISDMDINQGAYGDCYLLSAIGEIAKVAPDYIKNTMIKSDGHGGELVSLFTGPKSQLVNLSTTSFTAKTVDVTNSFSSSSVNSFTNSDVMNGLKEIWPQVIEKAYADLNGGYAAIGSGGYDMVAMETLTGHKATFTPSTTANLATLQNQKAGTIMEFDTPNSSGLGYNLVGSHAYMFDGYPEDGHRHDGQTAQPLGQSRAGADPLVAAVPSDRRDHDRAPDLTAKSAPKTAGGARRRHLPRRLARHR